MGQIIVDPCPWMRTRKSCLKETRGFPKKFRIVLFIGYYENNRCVISIRYGAALRPCAPRKPSLCFILRVRNDNNEILILDASRICLPSYFILTINDI